MGGEIGMHNNLPLPGATFWFELPLRPAAPDLIPSLPEETYSGL
jgi:hypothetical protein